MYYRRAIAALKTLGALTPNWGAAGVNGTQTHSGDRQLSSVHQSAEPHSGSLRARLVRLLPATARELVPTRAARRRRDGTLQRTAILSPMCESTVDFERSHLSLSELNTLIVRPEIKARWGIRRRAAR